MPLNLEWPPEVEDALLRFGGEPSAITSLRGLSHARVWRVDFPGASLIVKAARRTGERLFYEQVVPVLSAQGIATPLLHAALTSSDVSWLVLEFIPEPLPRSRWNADRQVLTLLHRLHNATLQVVPDPLFRPVWTDVHTEAALACLTVAERGRMAETVRSLQAQSQPLFADQCWISGDPNPLNWGVRPDGDVVLYDWERFGRGTPALDLAITIPGLGDRTKFGRVADQYLQVAPLPSDTDAAVSALTRQIAFAKVWNIIEFLSAVSAGQVRDTQAVPELVRQVPEWITGIAAEFG